MVLKDLRIDFDYQGAEDKMPIKHYDRVFIKVWDVLDTPGLNIPSVVDYLRNVDLNKVILISDHWDANPAFKSMSMSSGFLKDLAELRYTSKTLHNVYRPNQVNHIDPSSYVPEEHLLFSVNRGAQRWVIGDLNLGQHKFAAAYPMRVYANLSERQLLRKIAESGMTYIPEHRGANPLWWRIRYYSAALNGVAVQAHPNDSQAIYGFSLPTGIIEANWQNVARIQACELLERIEPKLEIQKKLISALK